MELKQPSNKTITVIVTVLASLLAISSLALGGLFLYNRYFKKAPTTVIVPDNVITEDSPVPTVRVTDAIHATNRPALTEIAASQAPLDAINTPDSYASNPIPTVPPVSPVENAPVLYLHNKNDGDNIAFNTENMFPGDSEIKYYCINVTYHDNITVKFRTDVHEGYEKLAEVLMARVILINSGELLYDGLMSEMPESLDHTLNTVTTTTAELYYSINAYLDTSVGSEYQDASLIADFNWWVPESGNLGPLPSTGGVSYSIIGVGLVMFGIALFIIIIRSKQRKEVKGEQ